MNLPTQARLHLASTPMEDALSTLRAERSTSSGPCTISVSTSFGFAADVDPYAANIDGRLAASLLLALLATSMSCASRTVGVTRSAPGTARVASSRPLGLDLYRPEPADNPTRPATVTLGRSLFRERRLSRDRSLACVDCHRPDRAFTDGRAKAVGVYGRRGARSVPTIVNRAWGEAFFWDGRIDTLEEQVLQPIVAELEMDLTVDDAVERLRGTPRYRTAFRETFGRDVNGDDLARALAAYVRTIEAGASAYDRYVWGEPAALSPEAQLGLLLPLFLSARAAVRAKTSATSATLQTNLEEADDLRRDARRYLALARTMWVPARVRLVAVGGGSGAGKTTLARRLAPAVGPAPGAIVLRSDIERKRLMGVSPQTQLGPDSYAAGVTRQVYRILAERAREILAEEHAVIVDAVYGDPVERAMLADVAKACGVAFTGFWLDAPLATLTARLESRTNDASDATPLIAARQLDRDTAPTSWIHLDATGDAERVWHAARHEVTTS